MCGTQCRVTDYITTFILVRRRYLAAIVVLLTIAAAFPVTQVHFDNALELWFTDDDRRIPVLMKASVPVGALDARLTRYVPGGSWQ